MLPKIFVPAGFEPASSTRIGNALPILKHLYLVCLVFHNTTTTTRVTTVWWKN